MKKRKKILLIDQHPEWLDFAKKTLREEYEIVTFSRQNDLLTLHKSSKKANGFDVVFIGLELVTQNLDVLKPLFKRWQFVVIFPVIQENETVRLLFKAGVYDCARKPYDSEGLLKLVADELEVADLANGRSKLKITKKNREEIKKQLSIMLNQED